MTASGGAYVREKDGSRRLVEAPRDGAPRGPREADGTEIDRASSARTARPQAGDDKKKAR